MKILRKILKNMTLPIHEVNCVKFDLIYSSIYDCEVEAFNS